MAWRQQATQQQYDILDDRYQNFLNNADDMTKEPVQVFDPLTPEQLQELDLLRKLSQELQAKKEEDMRRAAKDREEENKPVEKEKVKADAQEESKKEE